MLNTTLALMKSDSRICAKLVTDKFLFQRVLETFVQIKTCEVDLVGEFLIHEVITGPFVMSKILTIRIGQTILKTRFCAKVAQKKMTATLAHDAKAVLDLG